MTITSLFPRRTGAVPAVPPVPPEYQARHRQPYDVVKDILRKHANVVPARHSTRPDTMRAVFPR